MTSRRPYWCPKTMKRRPCWCPKPILRELYSFLMQTLSFVPINLHRCWPREWKHSISYSSSRLLMPRGSIVLALWIRWASRAFLKEWRPFLSFSIEGLDWSFKRVTIANVSFYSELYLRHTVISVLYYSKWSFWPCTNENKTVKGALNCPEDPLSCAEDSVKTWDFIGEDLSHNNHIWWFLQV